MSRLRDVLLVVLAAPVWVTLAAVTVEAAFLSMRKGEGAGSGEMWG